jgi:HEAT repeat protein
VTVVIEYLKGRGPAHQRALAAQILGEIGDTRAVNTLIEMLRDPEMVARGFSAEALGKLGDRQAIPALKGV